MNKRQKQVGLEFRKRIGECLRRARAARGFSLRELELLSGVDDAEIYRIEIGFQDCRLISLVRLCGPLGLLPSQILDSAVQQQEAA